MDTAHSIIEQLTCLYLKAETNTSRVYSVRNGYSTVFTDLFENVTSVKVDGVDVDYKAMFWDNQNTTTFNSIVLANNYVKEIEVTADWVIPTDLQLLEDGLTNTLTVAKASRIKSKRVEDFSITFNDSTEVEQFAMDNNTILAKYSICRVPNVQHGDVGGRYNYWSIY